MPKTVDFYYMICTHAQCECGHVEDIMSRTVQVRLTDTQTGEVSSMSLFNLKHRVGPGRLPKAPQRIMHVHSRMVPADCPNCFLEHEVGTCNSFPIYDRNWQEVEEKAPAPAKPRPATLTDLAKELEL